VAASVVLVLLMDMARLHGAAGGAPI
jgi:hypothetical protein